MKSMKSLMALVLAALIAVAESQFVGNSTKALPTQLNNARIGKWLQPNCFMGIMIMLFFFFVFYFGIVMLHQIQTPLIIREKTLNWGVVEEAE